MDLCETPDVIETKQTINTNNPICKAMILKNCNQ